MLGNMIFGIFSSGTVISDDSSTSNIQTDPEIVESIQELYE